MINRFNINLTYKLLFSFLFLAVLSIAVQIVSSHWFSSQSYYDMTREKVIGINNLKKQELENYFNERINNLEILSTSNEVRNLYANLDQLSDSLNIGSTDPFNIRHTNYISLYNKHINFFTRYLNVYEFDDIYLIDADQGQVMFTVQKNKDLGVNLADGRYQNIHLAQLWQSVTKTARLQIQDFEAYEPLQGKICMFIGVPVFKKDKVVAVLAIQLSNKKLSSIVNERFELERISETYLVGFNKNRETELKSLRISTNEDIGTPIRNNLIDAALKKEETGFSELEINNTTYLTSYSQLRVRNLTWGIFTSSNKDTVNAPIISMTINNLLAAIAVIFMIVLIGLRIAGNISKPIVQIKNNLLLLSKGILPKRELQSVSNNEIGQIQTAFNEVVVGMRNYVDFANKIGNKQLNATFEKHSENDTLGNSLLIMQRNLKLAEEEAERRQIEEKKQRWSTEGIAKFGDILRQNYQNMHEHANNIIQNLVSFLNVSQGGIFLYNEEEHNPQLNLVACFAYDRVKFIQKEVGITEGLIGACYSEKETIYLKNIPEDYANISSGLGSAKPKSVLIVPLKMDIKILGVIELVSFDYFEDHIISFVEKIAENIASSIHSSQINVQTQRLLEESRLQSEQMVAQEEEMRQNMEELQATQEESGRREAEAYNIISALKASALVMFLSLDGRIIEINKQFAKAIGIDSEKLIGQDYKKYNSIISKGNFFESLIELDENIMLDTKIISAKKETNIHEVYSVIRNNYEEPIKILIIAYEKQC